MRIRHKDAEKRLGKYLLEWTVYDIISPDEIFTDIQYFMTSVMYCLFVERERVLNQVTQRVLNKIVTRPLVIKFEKKNCLFEKQTSLILFI